MKCEAIDQAIADDHECLSLTDTRIIAETKDFGWAILLATLLDDEQAVGPRLSDREKRHL